MCIDREFEKKVQELVEGFKSDKRVLDLHKERRAVDKFIEEYKANSEIRFWQHLINHLGGNVKLRVDGEDPYEWYFS